MIFAENSLNINCLSVCLSTYFCTELMDMENMFGAGGRVVAARRSPQNLIFEEIVPSSGWTEDSTCRCLIIDLPGFKKDEVKLQLDNYGHLLVSGERQANEKEHVRFEQSYKVPDNSNIEDTTAKFEDGILYIVIPKIATADKEDGREEKTEEADRAQEENQNNNALDKHEVVDEANIGSHRRTEEGMQGEEEEKEEEEEEAFHDAKKENQWNEDGLLGILRMQLKKNKEIFVMAVLAFSLGVLVSQKFQTNQEK